MGEWGLTGIDLYPHSQTKGAMMTEKEWINVISKELIGKKIIAVEYMSEAEAEEQGWFRRPIQIKLDNGTWLTPSQDDEGNDGGSLFTNVKELPTIPVL